jgi:hypothetical protein
MHRLYPLLKLCQFILGLIHPPREGPYAAGKDRLVWVGPSTPSAVNNNKRYLRIHIGRL